MPEGSSTVFDGALEQTLDLCDLSSERWYVDDGDPWCASLALSVSLRWCWNEHGSCAVLQSHQHGRFSNSKLTLVEPLLLPISLCIGGSFPLSRRLSWNRYMTALPCAAELLSQMLRLVWGLTKMQWRPRWHRFSHPKVFRLQRSRHAHKQHSRPSAFSLSRMPWMQRMFGLPWSKWGTASHALFSGWPTMSCRSTSRSETSKYGAQADVKKSKKAKQAKTAQPVASQIDPAYLQLPPDVFATNDGTALTQLSMDQVVKNARGVAFATPSDALKFLQDGKFIGVEGLTLLVVGQLPEAMPQTLPMHQLRVPAIYRATSDPVILDCTSVQLGDQAVYQRTNKQAPEVATYPTTVFRAHVFQDLWGQDGEWDELLKHPIRSLVNTFDVLRLCRDDGCSGCQLYHPSCEETGIESGLLDVWGFLWRTHDGTKTTPQRADVLSVYLRIPESSFATLHQASGTQGTFFEPRCKDAPGVDTNFAVIWIPKATLSDAVHRVKTVDNCLTVCRIGMRNTKKSSMHCCAQPSHMSNVWSKPHTDLSHFLQEHSGSAWLDSETLAAVSWFTRTCMAGVYRLWSSPPIHRDATWMGQHLKSSWPDTAASSAGPHCHSTYQTAHQRGCATSSCKQYRLLGHRGRSMVQFQAGLSTISGPFGACSEQDGRCWTTPGGQGG